MTNINDLSLPQGMPTLGGYAHELSCQCFGCKLQRVCSTIPPRGLERIQWAPDVHAQRLLDMGYLRDKPREMTAEDLGLPLRQWTVDWLNDHYTFAVIPAPPLFVHSAPYSFWLGADHG